MLNVLLSFAQFEREIIWERTRDKMAAARRKGKWVAAWLRSVTTTIAKVANRRQRRRSNTSPWKLFHQPWSGISFLKPKSPACRYQKEMLAYCVFGLNSFPLRPRKR